MRKVERCRRVDIFPVDLIVSVTTYHSSFDSYGTEEEGVASRVFFLLSVKLCPCPYLKYALECF